MPKKPSKEIEPVKHEIEIILPLPDPETRMAFIKQRGEQIRTGDLTIQDLGLELNLTENMIEFVRLFVSKDYLGHGYDAAAKAYGYDTSTRRGKQQAQGLASTLKKHAGLITLMNCLIDQEGYNLQHMQ